MDQIAAELGVAQSTVSRVVARLRSSSD